MSSILKALKKLEDEKVARNPDSLRIDAEILRGSAPSTFSPFRTAIAALLLFVCGGGAVYLSMSRSPSPMAGPEAVPSPATPAPQSVVSAGAKTQPKQPPLPSAPTAASRSIGLKTGQSVATATAAAAGAKERTGKQNPVRTATPPPAPEALPSVAPARQAPMLKIDGIAFQDGMESMAIINGVPVARESVVEGVKVVDIRRDRVQFSLDGEKFEVMLGKTNR